MQKLFILRAYVVFWVGCHTQLYLPESQTAAQLFGQEVEPDTLQQFAIDQAVEECKGNLSAASRHLEVGSIALYHRLKKGRL